MWLESFLAMLLLTAILTAIVVAVGWLLLANEFGTVEVLQVVCRLQRRAFANASDRPTPDRMDGGRSGWSAWGPIPPGRFAGNSFRFVV
jgi:hypothetical protein